MSGDRTGRLSVLGKRFGSPSRTRTYNKPVNRRAETTAEKRRKPLVFKHFMRFGPCLQARANTCGRVRKTAEIPHVERRCAEGVRKIPREGGMRLRKKRSRLR